MLKIWFIAMRPWSFTATIIPIGLGTALAYQEGYFFDVYLFILTLLAGLLVQAGTNYINTWGDYVSGVDSIASAVTCPQLVTNILSAAAVKMVGIFCFICSTCIGLWLTYLCGWPILACGIIGIMGGYCYTAGPSPYKYLGVGSVLVFFLMGPLMILPAYYIQTRTFSIFPILVSMPISFLVSAILQSNDLRDIHDDRLANIRTLATTLGLNRSIQIYIASYLSAFLSLLLLIGFTVLPSTAGIPLLLLPLLIPLCKNIKKAANGSRTTMKKLVTDTAKFHFIFGILLILGILLSSNLIRQS